MLSNINKNDITCNYRYGENSWACITGGSDGVGRAMAHLVRRPQFHLICFLQSYWLLILSLILNLLVHLFAIISFFTDLHG